MTERKEKNLKEIFREIEERGCVVQKGIMLLDEFLDGPMCGRCLPCPMGSYEMRVRLRKLAEGEGEEEDIDALMMIAPKMYDSSMCKKGKDTAKFILDTLQTLTGEYYFHIQGRCPKKECRPLFVYRIAHDRCTMCGDCLDVCKENAIIGEKKIPFKTGYLPYEIVDKRCTRCDECRKVCRYDAVEIVDIKELESVSP